MGVTEEPTHSGIVSPGGSGVFVGGVLVVVDVGSGGGSAGWP